MGRRPRTQKAFSGGWLSTTYPARAWSVREVLAGSVGLPCALLLTGPTFAFSTPEVAVVAEFFQEMLQRDFGYKIYKALMALPEKEELLETKNPESEKEGDGELKEERGENLGAEEVPANSQQVAQVGLCVSQAIGSG